VARLVHQLKPVGRTSALIDGGRSKLPGGKRGSSGHIGITSGLAYFLIC